MRRFLVIAVALLSVVVFAAPSVGDTVRVRAAGSPGYWRWQPGFRHIVRGDRVVWKNPTDSRHRVVAYGGNWNKNTTLAPGERTRKRFRRRGVYRYRCTIPGHSTRTSDGCEGMCGTIHVTRR